MENGYFHETGKYAPETGIATGAKEPLVDEYEAATAVPTVDETTLGTARKSANKPRPGEDEIKNSGEDVAEPTSDLKSTGEDQTTRSDVENAHALDGEVNKLGSEVRPAEPQATKTGRKRKVDA